MRKTLRVLVVAVSLALTALACGGGDAEDQLGGDEVQDSATTEETTPTPAAPDTLADPTLVPLDPIETAGLDVVVDGQADDEFDRCSIFTAESLSGLLGDMWEFGPGEPKETIACAWQSGEGEDLGFVLVAMGAVGDEFDPRMGDSAATGIPLEGAEFSDEFYEIVGSTYGPGVAFRQGDVGVQVHVVWGTPNTTSRIAVEDQAELRIAENLSFRLPPSG